MTDAVEGVVAPTTDALLVRGRRTDVTNMPHLVLRIYPTFGIVKLSKVTRDPVTAHKHKASSKKHAVTTEASVTCRVHPQPRRLPSRFGCTMTISDIDAFSAEFDAILAAEGFSAPVRAVDPAVLSTDYRADPVADTRPQTVAELMRALRKSAQGKQRFSDALLSSLAKSYSAAEKQVTARHWGPSAADWHQPHVWDLARVGRVCDCPEWF
jgi:hypothetical protein